MREMEKSLAGVENGAVGFEKGEAENGAIDFVGYYKCLFERPVADFKLHLDSLDRSFNVAICDL